MSHKCKFHDSSSTTTIPQHPTVLDASRYQGPLGHYLFVSYLILKSHFLHSTQILHVAVITILFWPFLDPKTSSLCIVAKSIKEIEFIKPFPKLCKVYLYNQAMQDRSSILIRNLLSRPQLFFLIFKDRIKINWGLLS